MRFDIYKKNRIIIGNVAWGSEYIKNLFGYSISSILNSDRIREISREYDIHFLFITDDESQEQILNNLETIKKEFEFTSKIIVLKSIQRIKALNRITKNLYDKYQLHSMATQIIIDEVKEDDYLILNYSDFIWSTNSLNTILDLFEDSTIDVISCHPITLNSKSKEVIKYLSKIKNVKIRSEDIVDMSILHSQWWYEQYRWGNNESSDYLSLLYFPIEKNGYLFRGFHIHPIAFKGKNRNGEKLPELEFGTLDGYYLPRVLQNSNWNNFFIRKQSDMCIGALSDSLGGFYKGSKRNFINKLRDHVLKTHNNREINNTENYSIIINKDVDPKFLNKIIRISELNILNVLSQLKIDKAERDYEILIKQRAILKNINNLSENQYRFLFFTLLILKILMDCTLGITLLIIRFMYRIKLFCKKTYRIYFVDKLKRLKFNILINIQKLFDSSVILPIQEKKELEIPIEYKTPNLPKITTKKSQIKLKTYLKVYFEFLMAMHRRKKYE